MATQAVFITGFNNWGKSTIIHDLFAGRNRFYHGYLYQMSGVSFGHQFTVESHSNDDDWGDAWLDKVEKRINSSPDHGENLCTALCPTLHTNNNFIDLLTRPVFTSYQKLHVLLIEFKWEHHARLLTQNIITSAGARIPNVNFVTINADRTHSTDTDRWDAKINQVRQELNRIII